MAEENIFSLSKLLDLDNDNFCKQIDGSHSSQFEATLAVIFLSFINKGYDNVPLIPNLSFLEALICFQILKYFIKKL